MSSLREDQRKAAQRAFRQMLADAGRNGRPATPASLIGLIAPHMATKSVSGEAIRRAAEHGTLGAGLYHALLSACAISEDEFLRRFGDSSPPVGQIRSEPSTQHFDAEAAIAELRRDIAGLARDVAAMRVLLESGPKTQGIALKTAAKRPAAADTTERNAKKLKANG